jgi:transposase
MSMKKKKKSRQETFWIPHDAVASSPGHPFYEELERVLREEEFDSFVESKCSPYYAKKQGRPSIPPGVYFRMLLIGYFERIDSERGICWRCSDSLSLRQFLGLGMEERTPDHSSLSRIRNRLPLEVHEEAFTFSLRPLRKAGLLKGEAIGVDSSTVEANASLEKLTRREDGKSYREYVGELAAEAEGIDPEDTAAVAEFDRRRKDKKVNNEEWFSPNDPDAKLGPRKDGAWDMIHKVENAVDLDSGAILSVEVQPATKGDATDMADHFEKIGRASCRERV